MTEPQFEDSQIVALQHEMLKVAMKFTRNADIAEDLVQEANLKIFRFRDKFRGGNLRNWVFTIIYTSFISRYQRARKVYFNSMDEDNERLKTKERPSEIKTDSYVCYQDICDAIEKLEPKRRSALKLFLQGYEYMEIAEMLDTPLGTVKSRIFLARKELDKIEDTL